MPKNNNKNISEALNVQPKSTTESTKKMFYRVWNDKLFVSSPCEQSKETDKAQQNILLLQKSLSSKKKNKIKKNNMLIVDGEKTKKQRRYLR